MHDVSDPEHRVRLRVYVPRLLGETTPTGWALPAAPYAGPDQGFFTVPDIGAGVWIEFEEGDLSKPIWSGQWWGSPADGDIGTPDSTAREQVPAAGPASRTPETPQHEYPREMAEPGCASSSRPAAITSSSTTGPSTSASRSTTARATGSS